MKNKGEREGKMKKWSGRRVGGLNQTITTTDIHLIYQIQIYTKFRDIP